jgi:hypothetical protein
MAVVLDAGALIAIDRADRRLLRLLDQVRQQGLDLRSSSAVVAQVWRDGAPQARLSSMLRAVHEVPLDRPRSRAAGQLLALAERADVVDAAIVDVAEDGDLLVTSDPADLAHLAEARGLRISIVPL